MKIIIESLKETLRSWRIWLFSFVLSLPMFLLIRFYVLLKFKEIKSPYSDTEVLAHTFDLNTLFDFLSKTGSSYYVILLKSLPFLLIFFLVKVFIRSGWQDAVSSSKFSVSRFLVQGKRNFWSFFWILFFQNLFLFISIGIILIISLNINFNFSEKNEDQILIFISPFLIATVLVYIVSVVGVYYAQNQWYKLKDKNAFSLFFRGIKEAIIKPIYIFNVFIYFIIGCVVLWIYLLLEASFKTDNYIKTVIWMLLGQIMIALNYFRLHFLLVSFQKVKNKIPIL